MTCKNAYQFQVPKQVSNVVTSSYKSCLQLTLTLHAYHNEKKVYLKYLAKIICDVFLTFELHIKLFKKYAANNKDYFQASKGQGGWHEDVNEIIFFARDFSDNFELDLNVMA